MAFYPGSQQFAAPAVFTNSATFTKGISTSGVPAVTTPTVPATGTALANSTGVDVMVYVATTNATAVDIGGVSVGLASPCSVYLPAGQTITLTYTSAPTWVWRAV